MSGADRLTPRALNRATLARQLLLERAPLDPVEAVRRLLALQAQEPASPYLALWTRVAALDRDAVAGAIRDRALVRGTLMRTTLHLVTATDFPVLWAALAPGFRAGRRQRLGLGDPVTEDDVERLVDRALSYADRPRTNAELTAFLAEHGRRLGPYEWWWGLRGMAPFVHVPDVPNGPVRWSYATRPSFVAATSWLPEADLAQDPDEALAHLVERYLRAFGPATVLDVAQFTKIPRTRVRRAVDRLRPGLRVLADASGAELLDVPDGPLPDSDVPAPPRYLPMWDSVLLAYDDRSRVIPPEHRRSVIRTNGDVLPTFLVDGLVAGVWRVELDHEQPRVVRHPFRRLPRAVTAELDAEGEDLAALVAGEEPEVYRRYRRWFDRLG